MESWSRVQIFNVGDDYFKSLRQDIRAAKKSITLESYIFTVDNLTEVILDDLRQARERGLSVKIIIDGFGSYYSIPQLNKYCSLHNIELRIFHPLPYPSTWLRRLPHWPEKTWFNRMNRRNHRKISIIDEKIAYLGSLNFTQVHCQEFVGEHAWRDTGARLEGPPVKQLVIASQITYLRTIFEGILHWVGRWRITPTPFNSPVQLNTTQKMRRFLYRGILRKITNAEKRVYITTAYFLPKRSVMKALIKAKERGVDVKILLPGKTDVPFVKWAAFFMVQFLLQKRIPIFEYQKSILHAKTMLIDNEAYVGSFNLNYRSLFHDLEVLARFDDTDTLQVMTDQWATDLQNSRLISEKDFGASWLTRLIYRIAFRLRYML